MSKRVANLRQISNLRVCAVTVNYRSIWNHFLSFYEQRNNPSVLWLFYEDLLLDREACIRKLAEFANIPLDEELLAIAMEQSSFEFIKSHADKFDDHFILSHAYALSNKNLPPEEQRELSTAKADKVHKGSRDNAKSTLTEDTRNELNRLWDEIITKPTGVESYDSMRSQLSILNSQLSSSSTSP